VLVDAFHSPRDGSVVAPPVVIRPGAIKKFLRTWFVEWPLFRIPRSNDVLDLCCGYGFYFSINPHAVGIDGDPECVRTLRSRGYDVDHGDVRQRLPYRDGRFSWVLAHDVFEHFDRDGLIHLIAESHRVLRDDGHLVVIVPNRKGFQYGIDIGAGHVQHITRELLDELMSHRFRLMSNYAYPLPRRFGEHFVHNKEHFLLEKASCPS
jgi:SAM-dependent methyltransferase